MDFRDRAKRDKSPPGTGIKAMVRASLADIIYTARLVISERSSGGTIGRLPGCTGGDMARISSPWGVDEDRLVLADSPAQVEGHLGQDEREAAFSDAAI